MSNEGHQRQSTWRVTVAFGAAVLCAAAFVGRREWLRLQSGTADGLAWFSNFDLDSTPCVLLLALLPLCWFARGPLIRWPRALKRLAGDFFGPHTKPGAHTTRADVCRSLLLAVVAGAASLSASLHVAFRPVRVGRETLAFDQLPPAYHDEYSYLLQAETFLAGRWSFPSHPQRPELFDQMHVVNQGRYASRYFPATGAWMAAFVGLGHPLWGQWLAGALTAMFVYAAGRELGGNAVGFLAGLLTGLAPGMAMFSNLLLAHHPALVGLTLFLWMLLRMLRGRDQGSGVRGQETPLTTHHSPLTTAAVIAGIGLTFAMLARPMTAFGFGLPFGVAFFVWLWRKDARFVRKAGLVAAMGLPILAGFAVLAWQNHAITGDWRKTPYEQFNDVYTPRHAFGFNNGERAERRIAAGEARTNDAFRAYDEWGTNLTPRRAADNVGRRIEASAQWTLGIVPLLMAAIVFAVCGAGGSGVRGQESGVRSQDVPLTTHHSPLTTHPDRRWWLVAAAIVTLHLVHVPYWYDGIMHWHYVFETGPLLLLVFARSTQLLFRDWTASRHGWMPLWWGAVAAVALLVAYFPLKPFWSVSRVDAEAAGIAYSKRIYYRFRQRLSREIPRGKALVLVEPTAEVHFEFVVNHPDLEQQRVLLGRWRPGLKIDDIATAFPDRAIYLWRAPPGGPIERVASPRSEGSD